MDKPNFNNLNPNQPEKGEFKDEKLEELVGEKVKIVDYYEEDLPLCGESWVLIIEHAGQKYELDGKGGYDGESRLELKQIEGVNNE